MLTKPEHVRNWFAPFEATMTVCSIDLRVGGKYHMVFVTSDGTECSFRGTYLEIERPTRIVDTWLFEGWPDAEAVETVELQASDGVTKVTMNLAFRDQAGRAHDQDRRSRGQLGQDGGLPQVARGRVSRGQRAGQSRRARPRSSWSKPAASVKWTASIPAASAASTFRALSST